MVQLQELRNDPGPYSKLSEKIPLSAVRNRDRQDVDSMHQISDIGVTYALKDSAVAVTHTVVPEKYRIIDDKKKQYLRALLVLQWVYLAMYFSVMLGLEAAWPSG